MHERPGITRAARNVRRDLGIRIRELRVGKKLSQEKAAEAIGVHAKHLQRLELGIGNATVTTLVAIAMAYGVHVQDLFDAPSVSRRKA